MKEKRELRIEVPTFALLLITAHFSQYGSIRKAVDETGLSRKTIQNLIKDGIATQSTISVLWMHCKIGGFFKR